MSKQVNTPPKAVTIGGVRYASISTAARSLNISRTRISREIKKRKGKTEIAFIPRGGAIPEKREKKSVLAFSSDNPPKDKSFKKRKGSDYKKERKKNTRIGDKKPKMKPYKRTSKNKD